MYPDGAALAAESVAFFLDYPAPHDAAAEMDAAVDAFVLSAGVPGKLSLLNN